MKTLQIPKTTLLVALIALTVACGYSSPATTPPVAGSVPTISQLSPNSATAGGAAFTMTVNGTNYGTKAVVNWNGAAQPTTYVTGQQLTISVPASAIATATSITVTVTNPATVGKGTYGGGGTLAETSSPMSFTVN